MKDIIAIVDPFSTGTLYAAEFHKMGYETVAVASTDFLPTRWVSAFVKNDFLEERLFNFNEVADSEYRSRIVAVVAGCESGVVVADQLAYTLALKGNSPNSSPLRRDKLAMQHALKKSGLSSISTFEVTPGTEFDFQAYALDIDADYVVKPTNSVCSNGVEFVNGRKLRSFLKSLNWNEKNDLGLHNDAYIVQEFLIGTEYVVDLVIQKGDIFIASLCRYKKVSANGAKFVYSEIEILDIKDQSYFAILDYSKNCTKVLGLELGPAHMEIMLTKCGPIMIEVGARMHGGIAPNLFIECYSPHLLELSVNSYIGKITTGVSEKIKEGRIVLLINKSDQIITEETQLILLELVKKFKSFKGFKLLAARDSKLPSTIDLATCPGIAWFSHESSKILNDDVEEFQNSYDVLFL